MVESSSSQSIRIPRWHPGVTGSLEAGELMIVLAQCGHDQKLRDSTVGVRG
jgi:hypothetical protein